MRCLPWVLDVVESTNFHDLFFRSARRLDEYAFAEPRIDDDTLLARRAFEEMLKNLNRRAQAAGFDPKSADPDWLVLVKEFVDENVRIAAELGKARNREAYERGRRDERDAAAIGFGSAAAPAPVDDADGLVAAIERELERPTHLVSKPASTETHHTLPTPPVKAEPLAEASKHDFRISEVLKLYLADDLKAKKGVGSAVSEVAPTIQFMIDALEDPPLASVTKEQYAQIDAMLPDIPNRKNIPRTIGTSLFARYAYARDNGWDGLERLSEATVRNRYATAFSRFLTWAIQKEYMSGPRHVFKETSDQLYAELPRDAFEDTEILKLFGQPLYTGCESANRIWSPGRYFVQNHLYWGYLILLLTGMRPSEVAQLKLHQFVEGKDVYLFNLKPFDARKGRVKLADIPKQKTKNAARVVPIHPLLIELGLKERVDALRELGCDRLLPEWPVYTRTTGEQKPGQAITKSWIYVKEKFGFEREDLTLYSTRHGMAQVLDDGSVANRTRHRVLGHAGGSDAVPLRYGAKGLMTKEQAGFIVELETDLIRGMRELLMPAKEKADLGELVRLTPWLTRANWAKEGVQKRRGS
ncbi:MAG: hypothetical protein DI565_20215 [Ancylobacter novellus]|uniref:Tyr recombinase domain-containing protein n=1 Tax=Ancylobacter novellus TaxID=921 RepID=A0A2W5K3R9_ANCNO|nr:MAG: hypothetical protein DI565_20215 [Ancylobacter novellus]